MSKFSWLRTLSTAALLCLTCSLAQAQATRTWVSGVGDDVNPCSRTAPCKTFAGAISKTAAGGEINVLDPGGFGAVTITKSISIEAIGVVAGVLVSGTPGITINAQPTDVVVLKGLTLEGLGTGTNGVNFLAGGALYVENCTINHFQKGIDVTVATAGTQVYIKDTNLRGNTMGGIHFHPTAPGTVAGSLDNVRVEKNQFGLRADDGSNVSVRNSLVSGSASNGIVAFSASAASVISIENTMSVNNGLLTSQGGVKSTGPFSTVNITSATIFNNAFGLLADTGGAILSFGNNRITGNGTNGTPTGAVLPQQ